MNIYVSHSRDFDFKKELYEPLKVIGEHDFIFPHAQEDTFINSKELFKSGKCDLVLAEVSYPSTGQGIELAWANDNGIKVVCFSKDDSKVSGSLKLISESFITYKNFEELPEKLSNLLK